MLQQRGVQQRAVSRVERLSILAERPFRCLVAILHLQRTHAGRARRQRFADNQLIAARKGVERRMRLRQLIDQLFQLNELQLRRHRQQHAVSKARIDARLGVEPVQNRQAANRALLRDARAGVVLCQRLQTPRHACSGTFGKDFAWTQQIASATGGGAEPHR